MKIDLQKMFSLLQFGKSPIVRIMTASIVVRITLLVNVVNAGYSIAMQQRSLPHSAK